MNKLLWIFALLSVTVISPSAEEDVYALTNSENKEPTEFDEAGEPITGLKKENNLNGLLLEKIVKEDSSYIKLALLFSEEDDSKLTYFKTIRKDENSIVIDIYDIQLGNNILKSLNNSSLINSKVKKFVVDLNKDIPGLKPDIRNVIQLTLTSKHGLKSDLFSEDKGSLNVNLSWSEKKKATWTDFLPFF